MKDITKSMNILKVVLALAGIIVCIFLFAGPNNTADAATIEAFRDGAKMNAATYYTIFVLVACVALILFFFVMQLISNPKKTLKSIVGLAVAFVLYIILYFVGTSDTSDGLGLTESVGRLVPKSTIDATTAGLYVVFVGLGIAIIFILMGRFLGKIFK